MYRPRKQKLVRRSGVAALAAFAAMTVVGLSSIIHRSDTIPAAVATPPSASEVASPTAITASSVQSVDSSPRVTKFHLVASRDDESSSGDNEN